MSETLQENDSAAHRDLTALLNQLPASLNDSEANVFNTPIWLQTFTQHVVDQTWAPFFANFDKESSPVVLAARTQDPATALSFNNYYATQFSLPPSDAHTAAFVRTLSSHPSRFSRLEIRSVFEDKSAAEFQNALRRAGWRCNTFFSTANWYLPSAGLRFEAYMEDIRARTKNPVRRKTKAFMKDKANRIEILSSPDDAEKAAEIFGTIYQKSWRTAESHPQFVAAWIRACAKQGWLRLGVAWHGEQPIASQFWFVRNNTAYIYKMAYDDGFPDLSAGTVLSGAMFEHVLDIDQVSEVDYLSGDDAYKKDWVSHRRELVGIEAFNVRTLRGAWQYAQRQLKNSALVKYAKGVLASK